MPGTVDYSQAPAKAPARVIELPGHWGQLRVMASPARFKWIYSSRRWGKTTYGVMDVIDKAKTPNPDGLIWWVSPTYRQCRRPFRTLLSALSGTGLVRRVRRDEMIIELLTGQRIEFRTADQPDNLRGDGVNHLVVDEMAQISDEVWYDCLRPALSDTRGSATGIGTPRGRRGFSYENYSRGLQGEPGYESWKFTAMDAVFIPRAELEEARRTLPARAFDQEFMAAFLDGVGAVFENVRTRPRVAPLAGEAVGIGADWAKKVDFTWFVAVGAESGAILKIFRAPQRLSYARQVELLAEFAKPFRAAGRRAYLCHDQTGVGEAVADLLAGVRTGDGDRYFHERNSEGVVFTEAVKRELVEEAVVDFEAGKLGFVSGAEHDPVYEALVKEHEDFSLDVSKTGKISYGAPQGLHDDAVMATCLANRARRLLARPANQFKPRVSFV